MAKSFPVTVHPFTSPTPSSCAYERGDPSSRNALVFLGGLTSGPHTSPQAEALEALQAHPELNYSFWEFRMRSSYAGFGFSSLANDAEDLAALVTYLKSIGKEKVVLLGNSTGSFFALHSADYVY
jgi:pimeloyl-ACP methyl ester carboxylesterase